MVPYDLICEEFIALPGVLILVVVLAGLLSSQDDPARRDIAGLTEAHPQPVDTIEEGQDRPGDASTVHSFHPSGGYGSKREFPAQCV